MINNTQLPLLALKDVVLFPGMLAPIYVGRDKSINAVSMAKSLGSQILLVTQKSPEIDDPKITDLYNVGVVGKINQLVRLPNNHLKILVEIIDTVKLKNILNNEDIISCEYEILKDHEFDFNDELTDLSSSMIVKFSDYIKLNKKINPEVIQALSDHSNPAKLSNIIASHILCNSEKKQKILEEKNVKSRIEFIIETLDYELTSIETDVQIQSRVKKQIEKTQKDYYLNEQIKAIQKELGEDDKSDISALEDKIEKVKLSKEAKEKAISELKKLKLMNPMASESGVIRNYLDTLLSLPWGKFDKSRADVKKAESILERDHYGLEKVKERIIEYVAVLQRSKKPKGSVICFVGPPGVGKTSLAKSIAEALGRQYVKFSLGGVRDEAEMRGHRKTYLGSMPGKIINLIKKAKTSNPVMLLDEIDKMGSDFRGDPTSALLEVLDPEQNIHFADHYLEVEYDLSNIVFIATANSYNLPRPLLDRMEIINISGYIEDEKLHIAKNHLLNKILKSHEMKNSEFSITDAAILDIIRYYTKESGVRNLEREISKLVRKSLKKILYEKIKNIHIDSNDLEEYLGIKKYKFGVAEEISQIGVTTGLAYTEVGGDLLSIEAVFVPGKGEIKATGKLGDVMKESSQTAYSYFRSQSESRGINTDKLKDHDIHLHVPEGAVPKDGPSAGIAIYTTIFSLLTGTPVRQDLAMTGEITLRGKVLPIGGLREKLLAASRGGIKTVIIPEENVKDLKDIPETIKSNLEILSIKDASQLMDIAFDRKGDHHMSLVQ